MERYFAILFFNFANSHWLLKIIIMYTYLMEILQYKVYLPCLSAPFSHHLKWKLDHWFKFIASLVNLSKITSMYSLVYFSLLLISQPHKSHTITTLYITYSLTIHFFHAFQDSYSSWYIGAYYDIRDYWWPTVEQWCKFS